MFEDIDLIKPGQGDEVARPLVCQLMSHDVHDRPPDHDDGDDDDDDDGDDGAGSNRLILMVKLSTKCFHWAGLR